MSYEHCEHCERIERRKRFSESVGADAFRQSASRPLSYSGRQGFWSPRR